MRKAGSLILLLVAVALLWSAGGLNRSLVRMRTERAPGLHRPLENAPPLVVFTSVALGGFRGLLSDLLWLRVSYLQDRAEYFEIVQLADWITHLDPRSTETWGFHAWNMAYNVSAMMSEPEDRWRWVSHGLRLLRDEGLAENGDDPAMYCQLAWLYQFKIGGAADPETAFLQRRLADQMTGLLGGGRPDYAALAANPELAARLGREVGLAPDAMRELDARYGPLDWRLPETQAIYWAWRGGRVTPDKPTLACRRVIYQCLATLFLQGRFESDPATGALRRSPDRALLPRALQAYEDALADYPVENVRDAYAHFLARAVVTLHDADPAESRRLFELLRTRFPSPATAAGYEAFVRTAAGG